jgi:hypothetical protein
MLYKRFFGLLLFVLLAISQVFGQEVGEDYGKTMLRKEWNGFGMIHSNGWGFGYRKGLQKTILRKYFYEFEFNHVNHDKEISGRNPYFSNAKSYSYGKLNRLNVLRAGVGVQHVLNLKPYWGGTEVRYFYYGGFSLGITSPVYLYIFKVDTTYFQPIINVEKYNPDKHDIDNIYGGGPLGKGWFELTPHPGAYLKTGLSFEFGSDERKVRSLDLGAIIDVYPYAVELMAYNPKQYYFFSFYLSLHFGARTDYY